MGPLRKKSWWQKIILSRFTLVFLLLAASGLSFAVYDRYQVERDMYGRSQNAEADLKKEVERKEVLEDRVDYLNNEQGMEAEIRRHFDVALEGEQVVVIIGDSEDEASSVSPFIAPRGETKATGFWTRWLSW